MLQQLRPPYALLGENSCSSLCRARVRTLVGRATVTAESDNGVEVGNPPIRNGRRPQMMSDMFDDDSGDSSAGGSIRSGKHCDACNEWLDSSDAHCPSCGSER